MSWFSSSDQPDSQPDPESELRSLELFTPTGADRAMALSVLRRFTEATADGRTEEAQAVLDAVEPEAPTGPTIAKGQRTSVPLAGRELLIADTDYTGAKLAPQGRGIGYSGFTPADDRMVEAFGAWLSEQDDITGPDPDQEKELLQSILALTRVAGIDLHNPNDMEAVLGFVHDLDADDQTPADATTAFLLTLDDYVHFQWERARSPEAWERADEAVEAELGASDEDADQVVDDAISATRQVDPAIRRTTLMGTLAVTAVRDILGWVGKEPPGHRDGKPATGRHRTGGGDARYPGRGRPQHDRPRGTVRRHHGYGVADPRSAGLLRTDTARGARPACLVDGCVRL